MVHAKKFVVSLFLYNTQEIQLASQTSGPGATFGTRTPTVRLTCQFTVVLYSIYIQYICGSHLPLMWPTNKMTVAVVPPSEYYFLMF